MPHTAAIAACEDQSVLGRAFYLMGYVDGWSPMNTDGWPAPFDTDLEARQGLAFELVDAIARLSKVDWQAKGLQDLGRPDGFHERQVDRWTAFLERIKGRELPGFDVAAAWLRAHRPLDFIPGIMHGDYQFANVMYHHGAPARMAAIVDWEMGTVGDPKLDLAWVVNNWPEDPSAVGGGISYVDMKGMPRALGGPRPVRPGVGAAGRRHRLLLRAGQVEARRGARAGLPARRRQPDAADLRAGGARPDARGGRAGRDHGLRLVSESSAELVSERRGSLSILRLNRPDARNALSSGLLVDLGAAVLEAEADPGIRAVVLTGTGDRAFCAGMDLSSLASGEALPGSGDEEGIAGFFKLIRGEVVVPVVGAANGSAVAGGLELLLGCDVVVAARGATFGLPEVKRGLFAAGGGTWIGTRIPLALALELALTGDLIDADAGRARSG